jgi:hypothetical protein
VTGPPPAGDNGRGTYARRSRFWQIAFRVFYRFLRLVDPLIRSSLALGLPGLGGVVELHVAGRRSGLDRRILVTLLHVDKGWYVGHPNGESAWTRNLEAAGVARVDPPPAGGDVVQVVRLPVGPERDAVVRATRTQQPFPGSLVYRAANRHIAAVGVYFRLVLN